MDKAQKQLINTYYRKRNLAVKEDTYYSFKDYEFNFGVNKNLINPDVLKGEQHTKYYNNLWGTNYEEMTRFGIYGGEVAVISIENNAIFVNKQGEPDITGIDPDKINDKFVRAVYYNTLWKTDYNEISRFGGALGISGVAFARDNKNVGVFINKQGELDITGINPDDINDEHTRAAYYNVLWGTDYLTISKFGEYGGNVAYAHKGNFYNMFLNKQGKPDVSGINPDNFKNNYNPRIRAAYYNVLLGTDYTYIGSFGEFGGDVAYAQDVNINSYFLNKQGEYDITGINPDKLPNNTLRNTYNEIKMLTDY